MNNNKKYKHFVITRFNVRASYGCKLKNPNNNPMNRILDEDYLEDRFELFEKYTLKSLKNQTNHNFIWLILFHKNTPEKFKKKIKELKLEYEFVDLYFDDSEKFDFEKYCKLNNEETEFFITSRIDNDDMFADNYIDEIQKYADKNLNKCIISFEKGLKFDLKSNKKYLYSRKDNHFLSMIGKVEDCILKYNHAKIFESDNEIIIIDTNRPMWIEIIHDSNVINRIKQKDYEMEILS